MNFFFTLILISSFLLFAQDENPNSDADLEFLSLDALKNELLRRKLNSGNAADSFSLELSKAAVFYHNKKWDSAYFAYVPLLEKASDFLYGPLTVRIAKCELERGNIQESRKLLLEGILQDTTIIENAKQDSSKTDSAIANYKNANNLWAKGLKFEQAGEYKKAIDTYKRLYDAQFGKNQRRQWAKFRVGFINFK